MEWRRRIQWIVDEIDGCIQNGEDEALTLSALSRRLGYSEYHATRMFRAISGMTLRDYLRLRRLAFALLCVRDTRLPLLSVAQGHGFSSHEAFTRAFRATYGVTPAAYRKNPKPVVLRTKVRPFDCYILGLGVKPMIASKGNVQSYFVSIPAHMFLHIKNYESDGYFDFWQRQDQIPGQDCDTVCGLLDSIKGKLDGDDGEIGKFSGQIMAHLFEAEGMRAEAYGVRLPEDYRGPVPEGMLLLAVGEAEYTVFEHGPFDFESESESVGEKLEAAIDMFDFSTTEYALDEAPGRLSYFHFIPERFEKRILPVKRKAIG